MLETEGVVPIEFFFRKTELIVTFLVILLGVAFGNLRIKGVGFGSSGVLIIAMIAGYLYQFEPIIILQDLGIVLFLLCVGLEAGPSFFRAFKQHGKRYIINVLVLLAVAGVTWLRTSPLRRCPWVLDLVCLPGPSPPVQR